jgi:hypothetical protein
MKKHNKLIFGAFFAVIALTGLILFFGCKKEATLNLGAVPVADFSAIVASDGHTVTLVNNTDIPSMPYWAVPDLNLGFADLQGDSTVVNFIFPNTYTIKMLVVGAGGIDSLSKEVTTTQADPTACDPTKALGFIASCTQKTWKLNPDAGAYKVGPGANDGSWWSNGVGDVTSRSCEFNDTYVFKFNAAGDFIYNNLDDFYADGYMGNNTNGCEPSSNFTAGQAAWGSGNFKFALIPGAGSAGLGQLKVIGFGAHIGLQKVTNAGEITSGVTATSITYDILVMNHGTSYDLLVLGVPLGWGWWTFTLRSF